MFTTDDALDFALDDGDFPSRSGFWGRLVCKFVIVYVVVAFLYRDELQFRRSAIPVAGRIVEMFDGPQEGEGVSVKYTFRDPATGAPRFSQASLSRSALPESDTVAVEYIPGEDFRSRLAVEARPSVGWVFLGMNSLIGATISAWLGFVIWEANHTPLTRQQRAVAALRRERAGQRPRVSRST